MNKQQLAAKIWKSANEMRSKIEASEYSYYEMSIILDVNEKNNLQMAFTIYNQKLIISLIYKFYIIL